MARAGASKPLDTLRQDVIEAVKWLLQAEKDMEGEFFVPDYESIDAAIAAYTQAGKPLDALRELVKKWNERDEQNPGPYERGIGNLHPYAVCAEELEDWLAAHAEAAPRDANIDKLQKTQWDALRPASSGRSEPAPRRKPSPHLPGFDAWLNTTIAERADPIILAKAAWVMAWNEGRNSLKGGDAVGQVPQGTTSDRVPSTGSAEEEHRASADSETSAAGHGEPAPGLRELLGKHIPGIDPEWGSAKCSCGREFSYGNWSKEWVDHVAAEHTSPPQDAREAQLEEAERWLSEYGHADVSKEEFEAWARKRVRELEARAALKGATQQESVK